MSRTLYCPDCSTTYVIDTTGHKGPRHGSDDDPEGDIGYICGRCVGYIRAMMDDRGRR